MVLKLLNETNCDAFQKCIDTNTNLASIDEAEADTPVGIGKDALGVSEPTRSPNDRIILKWQEYARRYDPKTVEAHLYAIRSLERFHQQKPFRDLTIADVAAWRDDLLNNVDLSRSTIRHRASHVRAFLDWLSKQEGHRSLAPLSDYLELPRKFHQRKPQEQRAYPTLKEAEIMLGEMSSSTLKERRDRALVACAYVSGFRADALVSLRLRHVDVANRLVFHDGQEIRAKNGKTFTVFWFPRTESFQKILVDWVNEVQRLGFGPDDALFPELAKLESACQTDRAPIDPMTSSAAVTQAFKIASDAIGKSYSPHSVRDSLAHLRDEICRTPEQRKAFSANLGHSSEKVTETYYGKVDDQRREEIFRAFDNAPEATNEELELLVAYHERELIPGSPEFNRARAASRAWQMRRR
jgi:integrase